MAFTNTVETVGDAALTRSIIDRSITELNCNITTSIRQQAFRACSALASVNFPSVTSVALGAFWQCTALAKAEFGSVVAFANNAFYGCSALTALILRSTDAICTISGTPFASSAIAAGNGYIYVPKALVDQYKTSWSAYAGQVRAIEDYPGVADTYSWAGVAANIADGSYKSVYKVGDLVPLDLGTEGVVNMQIAAFDEDNLADGSGKAPISWISKELLATAHRMNPARVTNDDGTYQEGTGAIGGWGQSELRAYYNDTLLPLISSDVAAMIKTVSKTHDAYDTAGIKFTQTTEDGVWLPSYDEIITSAGKKVADYSGLFRGSYIKYLGTSAKKWWFRNPMTNTSFYFSSAGGVINGAEKAEYGYCYLALGFCT